MEQRAKAAGKKSAAAVYRRYINSVKKIDEVEKYFDYPSAQEAPPILNEPSNPEDKKYLVIIPGGFKPPHLGHYNLVKSYLNHPSSSELQLLLAIHNVQIHKTKLVLALMRRCVHGKSMESPKVQMLLLSCS